MDTTLTGRAELVAEALEREGFSARVWEGGRAVRVYVRTGKGKDCGYVSITAAGCADREGLTKQAGTIAQIAEAALAGLDPIAVEPAAPRAAEVVDEDVAQHEESRRQIAAGERD